MKKFAPYIFGGLGLFMMAMSAFLRAGSADTDAAITNLASSFMLFAGCICFVVGIVMFFMKDDPEEW
ncbi:MAG: hypothetical protein K2X27_08940 [Candidatus Obscuribacterales bacterium]|nr:hypothetical protein [Candidatus Obscuribacterales bacterium]